MQQQALNEQEKRVKNIIEVLEKVSPHTDSEPNITVYEGIDGLKAFQNDLLASDSDELFELTSIEKVRKFLPPKFSGDARERIASKFKIKSLYTSAEGPIRGPAEVTESRKLDSDRYDVAGEVVISGDRVALISYGKKMVNISIKNSDIARTLKTLFLALWREK